MVKSHGNNPLAEQEIPDRRQNPFLEMKESFFHQEIVDVEEVTERACSVVRHDDEIPLRADPMRKTSYRKASLHHPFS